MSKTLINIKTDTKVKKEAQKIAKELGVPLSTVVNAYLKEFVRERSVKLSLDPQLRPEVAKMLCEASEDIKKGRNISGPFETAEEMIESLNS